MLVLLPEILIDRLLAGGLGNSRHLPRPEVLADRLLAALRSGAEAGGDSRGLMSAAMLIVVQDKPTLTLRVDYDEKPIDKLESLLAHTRDPAYSQWVDVLPTIDRPYGGGTSKKSA